MHARDHILVASRKVKIDNLKIFGEQKLRVLYLKRAGKKLSDLEIRHFSCSINMSLIINPDIYTCTLRSTLTRTIILYLIMT